MTRAVDHNIFIKPFSCPIQAHKCPHPHLKNGIINFRFNFKDEDEIYFYTTVFCMFDCLYGYMHVCI